MGFSTINHPAIGVAPSMENPITSRISHREMLPLKVPRYAFDTVEGYQRILHSLGLAETAVGHVYYVYYTESIESSGRQVDSYIHISNNMFFGTPRYSKVLRKTGSPTSGFPSARDPVLTVVEKENTFTSSSQTIQLFAVVRVVNHVMAK